MKFIRECDLERAFTTMVNKLIFARKEVLISLLNGLRGEAQKCGLLRIDEIDRILDQKKNKDRPLPQ